MGQIFNLFFLQSGVATVYYLPPNRPVFNIRLLRTNLPHILLHHTKHLLLGLPLLLLPGNSISIIFFPTHSWSLLMTCPYHLSLPSLIFIPNRFTLTVPLMYLFLILSFLVTLIANLNIFISATSISSTCFFVTATVSSPYTIAGLTTELYTFRFTLAPVTSCRRLLPILFSIRSILPVLSSLSPSHNQLLCQILAPLITNT